MVKVAWSVGEGLIRWALKEAESAPCAELILLVVYFGGEECPYSGKLFYGWVSAPVTARKSFLKTKTEQTFCIERSHR